MPVGELFPFLASALLHRLHDLRPTSSPPQRLAPCAFTVNFKPPPSLLGKSFSAQYHPPFQIAPERFLFSLLEPLLGQPTVTLPPSSARPQFFSAQPARC